MSKLNSLFTFIKKAFLWRSYLATMSCIAALFFSTATNAQTTPANCTQGCTSNDVQIINAYLSNSSGTKLPSNFVCPAIGYADVFLTLELTTNTPRKGVAIFTKVKQLLPADQTHPDPYPGNEVLGSPISQCFSNDLNQPTNKVTFNNTFRWTCGTSIVLTDVFIAWGTGNKNFCTGPGFQCPATPSKCYSLPGDQFIAIETPSANNGSATLCSTQPGGTTANFNLDNISVTSSSNVTVTWWENYTAPSTFSNPISGTSSYSSASKSVYAKITSNSDNTVFSVSTVTLTVNQTPSLTITNPLAVCEPATVDITVSAVTAGSTLPAGTTLTYYLNSNGAPGTQITNTAAQALGNGTYWIKATTNTNPACSDQRSVVVTVNSRPVVSAGASVCVGSTITLSPTTGGTWSSSDPSKATVTNAGVVTGVAAGSVTFTFTETATGCSSTTSSVTVNARPVVSAGASVCVGSTITLSPTTGGTWSSSDPSKATVTNAGVVTGVATGSVTFTFTETATQCSNTTSSVTVNARPDNASVTVTPPTCANADGTVTVTAPVDGGGVDYEYSNDGGNSWQDPVSFTVVAGANYSITVRIKITLCTSAGATSGTMGAQPSGPSTPAVCVVQPSLCGPATGKVQFTDLGAGYQYTINGTSWYTCPVFINVPAGAATSIKVKNSLGCESPAANCNTICTTTSQACTNDLASQNAARMRTDNTQTMEQQIAVPEQTKVTAFPNPFSDKVRFIVTSAVAGQGSLEVYNMLGQKVKTVYQGKIITGNQNFELNLPPAQRSNLIYVLRVGDTRITGKLLNMKP